MFWAIQRKNNVLIVRKHLYALQCLYFSKCHSSWNTAHVFLQFLQFGFQFVWHGFRGDLLAVELIEYRRFACGVSDFLVARLVVTWNHRKGKFVSHIFFLFVSFNNPLLPLSNRSTVLFQFEGNYEGSVLCREYMGFQASRLLYDRRAVCQAKF